MRLPPRLSGRWRGEVLGGGGEDFLEAGEGGEDCSLTLIRADHEDVAAGDPRLECERRNAAALALEAEGAAPGFDPEVTMPRLVSTPADPGRA